MIDKCTCAYQGVVDCGMLMFKSFALISEWPLLVEGG